MVEQSTLSPAATVDFLRTLRQVRRFTPEPVPEDVLNDLLEVARWSGSSNNTQPWEFIVVRDKETLGRLGRAGDYSGFLADAAVAIAIVLDGKNMRSEPYDEGRVTERLMLAARAHGLGSGTGWWGTEAASRRAKEILGVPQERELRSAVAVGYPDPQAGRAGGRP